MIVYGITNKNKIILGGNTLTITLERDGLLWVWGRDAIILSHILRIQIRTACEGKNVVRFICFRYKGNVSELQDYLNRILPYNIAIVR
jgi:hypothetical protein